jgi:hypothetical protein
VTGRATGPCASSLTTCKLSRLATGSSTTLHVSHEFQQLANTDSAIKAQRACLSPCICSVGAAQRASSCTASQAPDDECWPLQGSRKTCEETHHVNLIPLPCATAFSPTHAGTAASPDDGAPGGGDLADDPPWLAADAAVRVCSCELLRVMSVLCKCLRVASRGESVFCRSKRYLRLHVRPFFEAPPSGTGLLSAWWPPPPSQWNFSPGSWNRLSRVENEFSHVPAPSV